MFFFTFLVIFFLFLIFTQQFVFLLRFGKAVILILSEIWTDWFCGEGKFSGWEIYIVEQLHHL